MSASETRLTIDQLNDESRNFIGTENYYLHATGKLVYTDGVKWLAETGQCYWLIDVVASYQPEIARNDRVYEFQAWRLTVGDVGEYGEGKNAVVECGRDIVDVQAVNNRNHVVVERCVEQKLWTDLPGKGEITLYCIPGQVGHAIKPVLMLTSEY